MGIGAIPVDILQAWPVDFFSLLLVKINFNEIYDLWFIRWKEKTPNRAFAIFVT